jgi:pimeloyl-ACP methyl ester carboxylesterase
MRVIVPYLQRPPIAVPTIDLRGECDGVSPPGSRQADSVRFTGPCQRRVLPIVGHFLPREAPEGVVEALLQLR